MPTGEPINVGQVRVNHTLLRLLADVERAGFFYEPLSPQPTLFRQLRDLEAIGYIRYCPYPEEFWIMLPAGRDALLDSEYSPS